MTIKTLNSELSKNLDKKINFLWDRKCYHLIETVESKWISRIPNSIPNRYSPFDNYDPSGERHKNNLHLIFASLDPYDTQQISDFCFNWGMLGLFQHEFQQYYLPTKIQESIQKAENHEQEIVLFGPRVGVTANAVLDSLDDIARQYNISAEKVARLHNLEATYIEANTETSESVDDISLEIIRFKSLTSLRAAIINKDYQQIKNILNIQEDMIGEKLLELAQQTLTSHLGSVLDNNVTPIIKWTSGIPQVEFKCETLLVALHIMLLSDILNDVKVKKCPQCGCWFSYTKRNPDFCSFEHQDNAKSARYKKKIREKMKEEG